MYSFERGFVPTLHSQSLVSICGCSTINLECVTCGLTNSSRLDEVISERRWYPGFTSEYEERSVIHFAEKFHPLISELIKACDISAAVNCFYYYPRFGFYNGLLDIFFLQDYLKVIHQLGFTYSKNLYLPEHKEGIVLDFLKEKHCDFLPEKSILFFASFQQHLNTVFSFRPLLSAMFVLLNTNNGEIDGEITDYFLRKYNFNCKESICFCGDFFDNSFIEFGLILILLSLFMCDLLVVKKKFENYRIDK